MLDSARRSKLNRSTDVSKEINQLKYQHYPGYAFEFENQDWYTMQRSPKLNKTIFDSKMSNFNTLQEESSVFRTNEDTIEEPHL